VSIRLSDIWRCFQGVVPSIIATADSRGIPNVTYLSQVYLVDDRHVALSCQFFNKTRRNLDENPSASVEVIDPLTLQAYRLRLKFLRSEKSGPLFDTMSLRIDAIAAHTGLTGVFRLIAADMFEVQSVEMVQGFLTEPPPDDAKSGVSLEGLRTEMRGLQWVSDRVNRAADLRYGRAIRREAAGASRCVEAEIPLPGLPDAQSILAMPLAICDRLVGVLVAEDRDPMRFGEWHEAYLEVIGNQIALGIDRMIERADEAVDAPRPPAAPPPAPSAPTRTRRRLTYYRSDDAIFVDDEYLIRNVPARILWKVLGESQRTGRTEFSNREMRLDAEALGLPPVKDNLESRLILLRHRLQEKCPDLQIVPTGRGRFALRAEATVELIER
jgi:hypothetical protein